MEKMMKDWIETWEKNVGNYMDEMVKSQSFMKNFMKTYEPALDLNKTLKKNRESFFQTFGVASRNDVVEVFQKAQDIEIKTCDLEEKLDQILHNQNEIIKSFKSQEKNVKTDTITNTPTTPKNTAKKNK
ncbi:MAG: hypothetical protein M0R46_12220 [Candidatus Muirbacterium halophilum]|nr:hypothetical protein [Candidatus Muirbacterium halophilum]MCK9476682.1 hypothetical protein [Candidatus Muirbacterium halophilum]